MTPIQKAKITELACGETLKGTGFRIRTASQLADMQSDIIGVSDQSALKAGLTTQDVTQWKMAWRAIELYLSSRTSDMLKTEELVTGRNTDGPDWDSFFWDPAHKFGFMVASFIYGGIHALAWNAHFRSYPEQLLWRISVSVVIGGLLAVYLLFRFLVLTDLDESRKKNRNIFLHSCLQSLMEGLRKFVLSFITLTIFAWLLIYVLARIYLVVESFINLSHLSAGAYSLPNWSAYFPHIS